MLGSLGLDPNKDHRLTGFLIRNQFYARSINTQPKNGGKRCAGIETFHKKSWFVFQVLIRKQRGSTSSRALMLKPDK